MAVTRAGMRVTAISSDGPRWLDGLAGSGSHAQGRGPSFRRYPGAVPSVTADGLLPPAPPELQQEAVPGSHRLDHLAQLRLRR